MHVGDSQTPQSSRPTSPVQPVDPAIKSVKGVDARRHRSMSVGTTKKDESSEPSERMKHTRDFKEKGFKANSRGNFIKAPFTTLEEMFKKLPETIGFNIEMSTSLLIQPGCDLSTN